MSNAELANALLQACQHDAALLAGLKQRICELGVAHTGTSPG